MTMVINGTNGITFPSSTVQGDAGVGYGQTWQNVTGSRTASTNYTNSTTKPILVSITSTSTSGPTVGGIVDGVTVAVSQNYLAGYTISCNIMFLVPVGSTYSAVITGTAAWVELR